MVLPEQHSSKRRSRAERDQGMGTRSQRTQPWAEQLSRYPRHKETWAARLVPSPSGEREVPCHTPIPPPQPCSQSSHTATGHRTAGQVAHMGRVKDQLHTLGPGRELPPPTSFSMKPMRAPGQRDGALAV